jgi:hypothetical protein
MANESEIPASNRCDGIARPVTPERLGQLEQDARNLNAELYKYRSDGPHSLHIDEAEAAGKKFWEELVRVPISERRALLDFVTTQNRELTKEDLSMPSLTAKMDSHAFLESFTIKYPMPFSLDAQGKVKDYIPMHLVSQGWGMCAEFKQPDPKYPVPRRDPGIEIPTFQFPFMKRQ